MGSYDAIIGSGKTSIIKNKDLLKHLANFSAQYKAGFEDETKSDHLLDLMMGSSKDFYAALSDGATRSSLSLNKRYTLKEKEIAVKNLYENEPFLAYCIQKTRWETVRVNYQKQLLKSLNRVLYQFNFNELTPEKEIYSKYVGSYAHNENIITISYTDESLYLRFGDTYTWELVQFNNALYYIILFNGMVDFSSNDDGATDKLLFKHNDGDIVEFKKVQD